MSQTDTGTEFNIPQTRTFLRKLWALTAPYFRSEEWKSACGLLVAVIVMNLVLVFLNVVLNFWNRDFFNALQNKDEPLFWHLMLKFCYIVAPYIAVAVYS